MLPIIPVLITGGKWVLGATITGVAGNWVSDQLGIGSDEGLHNPIPKTHWEEYGFIYISGAFFAVGFYTLYLMIKKGQK